MKLQEQGQGESHSHYRYKARQAKEIVVGDTLMKLGTRVQVQSVVWQFQMNDQNIWSAFQVRNLETNANFLFTIPLNEWSIVDSFKSLNCGCER
jgi:hypothetical protein